ncbi:MAG: FtsX-like permease family protein [Anaerolineales bacterium]
MNGDIKPNFLKPRWSKVFSDLWEDKNRTGLVVASIAVGVFAIGMIVTAYMILKDDINTSFASTNPANIEIWTDPFNDNLVRVLEEVSGVDEVESRYMITVRARRGTESWQSLKLHSIDDFNKPYINQLEIINGTNIPRRGEVIVSENFLNYTGFQVNDVIEIKLTDGTFQELKVVGLVIDQTTAEPNPGIVPNGYLTIDTIRSFALGEYKNHLLITAEGDGGNEGLIASISDEIEDTFDRNQLDIYRIEETLSTEHPMSSTLLAVIGILGVLGGLITILSSSLIINMLNALLTQQLRQIGVMKLVGGRSVQILGMYLSLISAYSLIALIVSVPLGTIAGNALAKYIAYMLGANIGGEQIVPVAIIIQTLIAFLVPLGAGYFPVNRGVKINVRRAISNYRPRVQTKRKNLLTWTGQWIQWISRPVLLSFRNTFRQKRRLVLTIFTLTVAGGVFIGVFNVRLSMNNMVSQLLQHFMGDVSLNFSQPYKVNRVDSLLKSSIPEIESVEGWSGAITEIWDEDDNRVTGLTISAPSEDSQIAIPDILEGRWLLPSDKEAMVISDSIYSIYPDLRAGDRLIVKIPGILEDSWEVIGIFRFVDLLGDPLAYANFDVISEKVKLPGKATSFRIITETHNDSDQENIAQQIDNFLVDRDFRVQSVETGISRQESASSGINILIVFLLIMALLIAVVGTMGLTGTMSINVLERTREIGVMRTIGAVDSVIMQSVIIEGLVIGIITWILAIGLSFPISDVLLDIIGETMTGSTVALKFNPYGLLFWLGVVIVLSILSSILPARNAARLTINEVLAYE